METPKLKFNKRFEDEDMLSQISLQHRLGKADPISENMADAELILHASRSRIGVLKRLLAHEKFSPEMISNIHFLIEAFEKKIKAWTDRKKVTKLIQDPVVYAVAKSNVKESRVNKLDNDIKAQDEQIQYTYDHIQETFPDEFEKIYEAFETMQKENRTN